MTAIADIPAAGNIAAAGNIPAAGNIAAAGNIVAAGNIAAAGNSSAAAERLAMDERVGARLVELRAELAEGRRALAGMDARRDELVAALLRLEGAAQVLEELRGPVTAT